MRRWPVNLDLSGLDALAAGGLFAGPAPEAQREVALDLIDFDPEQPRGRIDEALLSQLAASIRVHGVLQAICVRPNPQAAGRYIVSFGERRVRAARLAGRTSIPARIELDPDPYVQVVENLQREDLSPLDLAQFIARREQAGDSRAAIARKLGKPRSFITEVARLLDAPPAVRALCEDGRCQDVRTLYNLARAGEDPAPTIAPVLDGEKRITRATLAAADKGSAPGPAQPKRGGKAPPAQPKAHALQVALDGRSGTIEWGQAPSPTTACVRFEDGELQTVALPRLQLLAWVDID